MCSIETHFLSYKPALIELLVDAETAGLNLNNGLTIDGNDHALKFTDKGIALWGHALVLKDVNASMAGIGSTSYIAEWNWMSVCANKDASPTLDDATLTMDGAGVGNVHAIYFCNNNKLNLKNGSNLTIKNYKQDALEWDGGDGGYNVNIEGGSTYTSDHCRSGFTGTFIVTGDNSTVTANNDALTDIIFTGRASSRAQMFRFLAPRTRAAGIPPRSSSLSMVGRSMVGIPMKTVLPNGTMMPRLQPS